MAFNSLLNSSGLLSTCYQNVINSNDRYNSTYVLVYFGSRFMSKNKEELGVIPQDSWIHGETQQIVVPIALSEQILTIARMLDQGESLERLVRSRTIDFSGIPIKYLKDGPAVYLKDLLKAGYKIRPLSLVNKLRKDIDRGKIPE